MSFDDSCKLKTPSKFSSLPLVLAGPILRRVESNQACVWIACSKPTVVKMYVYRVSDLQTSNTLSRHRKESQRKPCPIGSGIAKPVQLGKNLYVSLVTATPITAEDDFSGATTTIAVGPNKPQSSRAATNYSAVTFPTGELLAYDLEFVVQDTYVGHDGNSDDVSTPELLTLKDLGLVSGKNSIAYGKQQLEQIGKTNYVEPIELPTFFVGREINKRGSDFLNILYGSCRKLHGNGSDSLAAADLVIAANLRNIEKRPSGLFLIGDQIYADDVAGPLIHYLTSFGITLLGFEERINGINTRLTEIAIGKRQQLIHEHAKFTSSSAGNHLLSFGEFAAMYLVAWNAENWPDKFPNFPQEQVNKEQEKEKRKKYQLEIEQLENARRVLPAVRRVLANIPTYMICDDHEITDDWNITKQWIENVNSSSCGKQVMANGLAAYWAFQAWGNKPHSFSDDFILKITEYLHELSRSNNHNSRSDYNKSTATLQDDLLKFHGWTFDCPTYPVTLFLDCRTQRKYDSFNGPPQLVNEDELHSLLHASQKAGYRMGDPIIIVVPTPVLGFDLVEKMQEVLAVFSSVYEIDLEIWSANKSGFARLLTFILKNMNPSHCIFISGDVHYGFTISGRFSLMRRTMAEDDKLIMPQAIDILQLNSSALKTTSLGKEVAIGATLGHIRQFFLARPSVIKGWNDSDAKSYDFARMHDYGKVMRKGQGYRHYYHYYRRGFYFLFDRVWSTLVQAISQSKPPPDWIAARSIRNLSGSFIPSTIIADNNIGLVSLDLKQGVISHKLLVANKQSFCVHEALVNFD